MTFFNRLFELDEFKTDRRGNESLSKDYYVRASSEAYRFDYNQDKYLELVVFEKRDGMDYLLFYDENEKLSLTIPLHPFGERSRIRHLRLKKISSEKLIMIVDYFEGVVDAKEKVETARLYFVTIDLGKKLSLAYSIGPSIAIKKESTSLPKIERDYELKFDDFDKDGVKELSVFFDDRIKRVYRFNKKKNILEKF